LAYCDKEPTMYRIPGVLSASPTTTRRAVPRAGPGEERERIALGLSDVVARRLRAAGEDLQAALGLMGDHAASANIRHAVDEIDQAIRDIPDVVFDRPTSDSGSAAVPGASKAG
jgi:signal transduction histidine kinase